MSRFPFPADEVVPVRTTSTREGAGKVEVEIWQPPGGPMLVVRYRLRCPLCAYPIVLPAEPGVIFVRDRQLYCLVTVACPAHWITGDVVEDGHLQRTRCGWRSRIEAGECLPVA